MNDETTRTESSAAGPADSTDTTDARATDGVADAMVKVPEGASETTEGTTPNDDPETLLDRDRAETFRRRWEDIQTDFVDRPRESVEQADRLVLEVVQQLQASFTLARERLESQWSEGEDASTEDLRQALRRYRSFFDRLLSA